MIRLFLIAIFFPFFAVAQDAGVKDTWWPLQKAPASVAVCNVGNTKDVAELNLAQSIAGLAAQAVNEGVSTECIWISTALKDYAIYYASMIKRLRAKKSGNYSTWELVNRYKKSGIIKGYVLYDVKRLDNSVNLATTWAGLTKGLLIDLSQEDQAKKVGLVKLADVAKANIDKAAFDNLRLQSNPAVLVIANPAFSNNRDYAIAHKSMVYYGVDSIFQSIIDWVKPLSPVIGWNKGDESGHIAPCTKRGLINTASDWCMNLPVLSAGTAADVKKVTSLDPKKIAWNDKLNYHSFLMSDGDNMQWTMGAFLNSSEFWKNEYNKELSMSFTSCVLNLSLAATDVYDYLVRSQPKNTSVVEYGGGYYYPDLFAVSVPEPEKILRNYASMINTQMKRTGTKVFGFICKNVSSAASQKAYQIYAEELEDITGMIAVQYSPYNGGFGKVFWVKNKKGIDIPVVTARYQLWSNLHRKGSGHPGDIARDIKNDQQVTGTDSSTLSWTIVHAWSRFTKAADGTIADAPKNSGTAERGVTPVKWTKDLMDKGTKTVSVEELLWRIRMQHNETETKRVIGEIK